MELTAAVALVGALLVPFIVALIVRPTWTPERKRFWALLVCIVVGLVVGVATGQVETTETVQGWAGRILIGLAVVTGLANGFYKALKDPVDALSAKTSPPVDAQA